ncbi:MAG: lipid-A-disaccharide synthase [Burkholderiales bacterium]
MRVAIVAGEASGDYLGAHLVRALRGKYPGIECYGIGGPRMQTEGFRVLHESDHLAVRGYVEVLRGLPRILKIRRQLTETLLAEPPNLFIGIDAPDFNLGLEEKLKKRGIATVQYVAPQVWAWRGKRVKQLRRACDLVLALLPFEAELLQGAKVPCSFVGHPLADAIPDRPNRASAREQFKLGANRLVIALLPGSRESEVNYMADLFVQTAKLIHAQHEHAHFLVPLLSRKTRLVFEQAIYRNQAEAVPVTLLYGHAQMAMTAADGVLLSSGTATLEAALLKRTMVVTYKLSPMTYRMIRRRGYSLPYVALPNILAGRFVVPEILQDDATPEVLTQALMNQISDKDIRARQEDVFLDIHHSLRAGSERRLLEALSPILERRSAQAGTQARHALANPAA